MRNLKGKRVSLILVFIFSVVCAIFNTELMADGLSAFTISSSVNEQSLPSVDAQLVAWQEKTAGYWDINAKDMATGNYYSVCHEAGHQKDADVDAGRIVWFDGRNNQQSIYRCTNQGSNVGQFIVVSACPYTIKYPKISEKKIVWQSLIDGIWQIEQSSLINASWSAPASLVSSGLNIIADISAGNVVCLHKDDPADYHYQASALKYSESSLIQLNSGSEDCVSPSICGTNAIWSQSSTGVNSAIYFTSLEWGYGFRLSTSQANQYAPSISQSYVVWADERDAITQIYLFDLNRFLEYRVSPSTIAQSEPDVSEELVVWNEAGVIKGAYMPDVSPLQITSPQNGANVLKAGHVVLEWNDAGSSSQTVTVKYSIDFGQSWTTQAAGIPNSGMYEMSVPDVENEVMIIKVSSDSDAFVCDTVWPIFVKSCSSSLQSDLNGDCVVDSLDLSILASEWMQRGI